MALFKITSRNPQRCSCCDNILCNVDLVEVEETGEIVNICPKCDNILPAEPRPRLIDRTLSGFLYISKIGI